MASVPKAQPLSKGAFSAGLFRERATPRLVAFGTEHWPVAGQYHPQLLGVDAFACRHDVQVTNPCRDV
jgi:hypothetical protein